MSEDEATAVPPELEDAPSGAAHGAASHALTEVQRGAP